MAFPAHGYSIFKIQSLLRIFCPVKKMMSSQLTADHPAFCARIAMKRQYGFSPFSEFRPHPSFLDAYRLTRRVVPVKFSAKKVVEFVATFLRTYALPAVWFIKNVCSAYFTRELDSAYAIILGDNPEMRDPVLLPLRRCSDNPDIPRCRLALPQVRWPNRCDVVGLKPVVNTSLRYPKSLSYCCWTNPVRTVHFLERGLIWLFHASIIKQGMHICTATNTWKKVAIATW